MSFVWAITLVSLVQMQTQPAAAPQPIDPCESAIISQTRAAIVELDAAEAVHGRGAFIATYEGTWSGEDHLMRPGMVRTLPVRLEFVVDPESKSFLLREIADPAKEPQVETTLAVRGRIASQPSPKGPFKEIASDQAPPLAADLACWLPSTAAQAALAARASCRPGLPIEDRGVRCVPITFTDQGGRACTALIDAEHRVSRVERLAAHQRLGDVCDWTQFDQWESREGVMVPRKLSRFHVRGASTERYDLSLAAFHESPAPAGSFDLPSERRGDIPDWNQPLSPTAGFNFVALAPGLWSVEIDASNTRVLVIERTKDLVVLDAPDGDATCGGLVAALKERFEGKPVALAAFGHHHPSPSGGLRALAASGAVILAPRKLEAYVRGLLSRPTSLGGPAIAAPADPRIEFFDGETTIDCGETGVRLIDIGERSTHAFSYVVFYFPKQRLVFEDDLGYFPAQGAARASSRLIGLVEALESAHVEPERLVQSWPVRDVKREVEWSVVADLVKAARADRRGE